MRSIDENVEKLETLYTFDGKIKIHSCYGKWYRDSIKSLIEPPYYPAKKKKKKVSTHKPAGTRDSWQAIINLWEWQILHPEVPEMKIYRNEICFI
jgi:hypothetical protein